MILPHNPFHVTPDSKDPHSTDAKSNFIDMVQYIDKNVGRLEDTLTSLTVRKLSLSLRATRIKRTTTSELKGETIRGGKGYTHDYGTHVPLIVNWPEKSKEDESLMTLSLLPDIFPTMVDAAKLPKNRLMTLMAGVSGHSAKANLDAPVTGSTATFSSSVICKIQ